VPYPGGFPAAPADPLIKEMSHYGLG